MSKMNVREMTQVGLLLAVGYCLRLIVPGYGAGMKPDVFLAMLFVIILMKRNFKITIIAGAAGGIVTAITTTFPGGQIPNLIDKLLTSIFVYLLAQALYFGFGRLKNSSNIKVFGRVSSIFEILNNAVIGFLGTLFSGTVFLFSALKLVGLPLPFYVLFSTVVVPTAFLNTFAVVFLYPIVQFSNNSLYRTKQENKYV